MEQGPRWQPTTREKVIGGTVAVVVLLIIAAYSAEWTGFQGQTLWDWLQLLVVPAVIAAGGVWFNRQQREREMEAADQQRQRELEVETQRAQDEALQAYIDAMESLMLEQDLRSSPEDSEARVVARSRTLTILPRLVGLRKASVIQFLYEAGLIHKDAATVEASGLINRKTPVVDLSVANLREADLSGANLSGADLRKAVLDKVLLGGGAALRSVLSEAELTVLSEDLRGAKLRQSDLRGASLRGAFLIETVLIDTDLREADLSGADLSGANLIGDEGMSNLGVILWKWVDLSGANLNGANLSGAKLGGALLNGANLSGAEGITNEELHQQAVFLKGAIMPNNQKYEDWLKDRKGRGGMGRTAASR